MERLAERKNVAPMPRRGTSADPKLEVLRRVVAEAPVVVWAFDRAGIFTLIEGKALERLGDRMRLHVGQSIFDVYAGNTRIMEACRRVLRGEPFTDAVVVGDMAFETQWVPMHDADGTVVGASGISVDVTARFAVEAALRESEDKFKRVFESSLDAVTISDLDGRFVDVNEQFTALTGVARNEAIGRSAIELGIWSDSGELRAARRQLREHRVVRNLELPFRNKTGASGWAAISAVVVEIAGQRRTLSFVRDVTEHRKTEAELRELSGRLLQLQDQERRRIALELHDSTAQTLAALAMNLALATKSDTLDARARSALEGAVRLADQCSQEIRTLAYLLHPPLLDEMGLVTALRGYVDGFAQRSGIALTCELPPEGDRLPREIETTLFRVAQESLTNIVRHSGSETAKIRLRRTSTHATLEVRDRGRGIPAHVLERSNDVKQLGVGIPGMRARVRQLGGSLDVTSGPRGATVRVSLPLRRGAS